MIDNLFDHAMQERLNQEAPLAARMGVPFWFDVLKRAINLRGPGANRAEKQAR